MQVFCLFICLLCVLLFLISKSGPQKETKEKKWKEEGEEMLKQWLGYSGAHPPPYTCCQAALNDQIQIIAIYDSIFPVCLVPCKPL